MAHHPTSPPSTPPKLPMILILGSVAYVTMAAMGPPIEDHSWVWSLNF